MKNFAVLFMVVGVLSVVCIAQEAQEQPEKEKAISVSVRTGVTNSYTTDFGMQCGRDSWQTEVGLEHKSGLYFGLFYTHGFHPFPGGDEEADWSREFDPTGGLAREMFGLMFDASITRWECWEIGKSDNDFWYPALEVSKEFQPSETQTLTPSVRVAFPISVAEDGDNGVHLFVKLTHGLQLSDKVSLETWGSLVRDDGGVGLLPGWLSELGTVVSYQLTDNLSIDAGVRGILLLSDMEEEGVRENRVIFSTNLALGF